MSFSYVGVAGNISLGATASATLPSDGDALAVASVNNPLEHAVDYLDALRQFACSLAAQSWTKQAITPVVYAVAANPLLGATATTSPTVPLFVAIGNGPGGGPINIGTSIDGYAWTTQTGVGTSSVGLAVAINTAGTLAVVVMVGASGQNVQTSSNGSSWTLQSTGIALTGGQGTGGVVYGGSTWCIVGQGSSGTVCATSTNGTSWTVQSLGGSTDRMTSVCWSPVLSMFIASGYNTSTGAAEVFTSPTGATWTQQTVPSPGNSSGAWVAWNAGQGFAMLVARTTVGFTTWTSTNGTTWTASGGYASPAFSTEIAGATGQPLAFAGPSQMMCIMCCGGGGTTTTGASLFFTSTNGGATWQPRKAGSTNTLATGICVEPLGTMVAVGGGIVFTGNCPPN
jgi:hypothetical protein